MLIDYDKIWRVTYFSTKNKQNGVNLKSYQIPPPLFKLTIMVHEVQLYELLFFFIVCFYDRSLNLSPTHP